MIRRILLVAALLTPSMALGAPEAGSPAGGTPVSGLAGGVETVVVTAQHVEGSAVSPTGASQYSITANDILALPAGQETPLSEVLEQMPGVAIDQNQQLHIRDTEGPQFQYQIDGVMVPLDVNTNPPFLSMINPLFIKSLDLLTGVLPARYSYATGGIVNIDMKTGCDAPGGSVTLFGGQRSTFEPSIEYGGCDDPVGYFFTAQYEQANTAFSSATPGPNPIHDWTNQGQAFADVAWNIDSGTTLSLIASVAASDNQLPNVPGLTPQFTLAGAPFESSANINSYLNFRDTFGMLVLDGTVAPDLTYKLAYSVHSNSQDFRPDNVGELIYQGVASTATHRDLDNTLEGDFDWKPGRNEVTTGFYFGEYDVTADDTSLVFPVNPATGIPGDAPVTIVNNARSTNLVGGVYVNDLLSLTDTLHINAGVRWDDLTGFTQHHQVNGSVSATWLPTPNDTLHAGVARYMQVPSFLGISRTAQPAFAGTTAAGPPGIAAPFAEDDYEADAGIVHRLSDSFTISEDNYYEITHHYLDTGQFGVVPIFAPFNYNHGFIWGNELALNYRDGPLSAYANLTVGRNMQKGVATGQFNFDPDELAYIDWHHIILDHQPLVGVSGGAAYAWGAWTFGMDGIYSSGLRAGFADTEQLPNVVQLNASIGRSFDIPGIGKITDRLVLLNVLDRVNLIRPAEGIGIFQAAYGPRFTVYDALTIPL
jgi:hypothetical protein